MNSTAGVSGAGLSGESTPERRDGRRRSEAATQLQVSRSVGKQRGQPALDRLYVRLGTGYIALVLIWLELVAVAGGMLSAVVATRLLARSFRPPLILVSLVAGAIVVGCGVPFALLRRDARPLVEWIGDGRPPDTASAAWHAGVTLIRRALPRCFALVSLLLIPAVFWAVGHYQLGSGGFPVAWIFTQLGIAVTAAYMFFVGEAMLLPMVEDVARAVPPGEGVRQAQVGIHQKVLLALAVTTSFAVLVSQAIGNIGHTPTSRMLGALAIALLMALTFTPVLIRAVTDSVIGPVRSRARVVTAADVERRRMERDLHDGAQQQLVLLGLKLGMVGRLIAENSTAAAAMRDELRADLNQALTQLRDLAHGIYPAVLENEGLPAALGDAARRAAIATELRCQDAGRYPPEVEAAVYFCCLRRSRTPPSTPEKTRT